MQEDTRGLRSASNASLGAIDQMAKNNRRYRLPSEDLESIDLTEDYRLMDTSSKAPRTKAVYNPLGKADLQNVRRA